MKSFKITSLTALGISLAACGSGAIGGSSAALSGNGSVASRELTAVDDVDTPDTPTVHALKQQIRAQAALLQSEPQTQRDFNTLNSLVDQLAAAGGPPAYGFKRDGDPNHDLQVLVSQQRNLLISDSFNYLQTSGDLLLFLDLLANPNVYPQQYAEGAAKILPRGQDVVYTILGYASVANLEWHTTDPNYGEGVLYGEKGICSSVYQGETTYFNVQLLSEQTQFPAPVSDAYGTEVPLGFMGVSITPADNAKPADIAHWRKLFDVPFGPPERTWIMDKALVYDNGAQVRFLDKEMIVDQYYGTTTIYDTKAPAASVP